MNTEAETCVSHWDTATVTSSNSQSNLLNAVTVTDSSPEEENPRETHEPINNDLALECYMDYTNIF